MQNMKLACTGMIMRPSNTFLMRSTDQCAITTTSQPQKQLGASNLSLKIATTSSCDSQGTSSSGQCLASSKTLKLGDRWLELQGIKDWEGLLDPLDDGLRDEILRYGEFVEAAYRCFQFDTASSGYAECLYPRGSMLCDSGFRWTGYKVTKSLHATCGVQLPEWTNGVPAWVSTQSSWIGYVAVCNDKDEITRLGRRDVVIAFRGTATCMEWLENLRTTLTCLPDDMAPESSTQKDAMVQSGFLSLYTSSMGTRPSLQDSIRDEIGKILQRYADEPLSITITGHSLGAALATLTAHDIKTTFKHAPLVTVVSFGGPRVGNKNFRHQLERSGTKVLRIVNSDDPITKVPGFVLDDNNAKALRHNDAQMATRWSSWMQKRVEDTQWVYAEIGKELRLSSSDCPDLSKGNVAKCHDLKTYLHLVDSFVSTNCPLRATARGVLSRARQERQQLLV